MTDGSDRCLGPTPHETLILHVALTGDEESRLVIQGTPYSLRCFVTVLLELVDIQPEISLRWDLDDAKGDPF